MKIDMGSFCVHIWVPLDKYLQGQTVWMCEPLSPSVQLIVSRLWRTQKKEVRRIRETVWCSQEEAMTASFMSYNTSSAASQNIYYHFCPYWPL